MIYSAGGVFSGADAYAKIRAGASLVQIYTAMVYEGPFVIARITEELAALLKHDGFASVGEEVGAEALRRQPGKMLVERQDDDLVGTQLGEQAELLVRLPFAPGVA